MKRLIHILALQLLIGIFSLAPGAALADETADGASTPSPKETSDSNIGAWFVSIYRDHISAVDGDRCPSYPSCGSYSVQAFRKHGFFMGWLMTVDRLIHEGREETTVSPYIYSGNTWKIYDPVENNDFWWYEQEKKAHAE
ncbi:MAG: membrane protein insertion efficiency factor YidD [Deltaproteobacteria bacterium]|nr:membrane protein insertion efficiency factor YidD [Deltaproteobacteria bacterium]